MKSYVLVKPQDLKIEEREVPFPKDDEVLIKVTNVGICGSDIHLFKGSYNGPSNYPMLFGHEWSGIVEKVGKNVVEFVAGDKVTGDCSSYCGHCEYCKKDRNLCSSIEKYGITIDGASSEYIVRNKRHIYKANPASDLELLSLTEPIAVAKHLIEKIITLTNNITDKSILVYGGGAIGQAALLLLKKHYGCKNVDLSDLVENRIIMAKSFGANIPSPDKLKWSLENNYYNMYNNTTYDIIIETTGVASVFKNAFNLLKPLGVLGCVGMIASVDIPQKLIVTKSLTVTGSIGGTEEFEEVIDFIQNNKEDVAKLISHKYKIKDAAKAFETALDTSVSMKVNLEI